MNKNNKIIPTTINVWKVEWNDKDDWYNDVICMTEERANDFAKYLKSRGNINIRIIPTIALSSTNDKPEVP